MATTSTAGPGVSFGQDLTNADWDVVDAALRRCCEQLRAGDSRVLREYLQESPLAVELLALWEGKLDSNSHRVIGSVLEVTAAILEGNFKSDVRTSRTQSSLVTKLLSDRLQTLEALLSTERDFVLKQVLRVLTDISKHSIFQSAHLLRTFNFASEHFTRLVGRKKKRPRVEEHAAEDDDGKDGKPEEPKKEAPLEVRHYWMRFALSFLRWNDPGLTNSAISIKKFISAALSGLKYDPISESLRYLESIFEHLLWHPQIAKHAKLFFFNSYTLKHISDLLTCDQPELADCAARMLKQVGADALFSGPKQQQILLEMCLDMKTMARHELQQEVLFSLLSARPRVRFSYCSQLHLPVIERIATSDDWFLHARFLRQLLGLPQARLLPQMALESAQGHSMKGELSNRWLLQALVPRPVRRGPLTKALLHQSPEVLMEGCSILSALLVQAQEVLESLSPLESQALAQGLLQQLPELSTLLNVWKKVMNEESTVPAAEDGQGQTLFASWCSAVSLFMKTLPDTNAKFDWTKMLRSIAEPLLQEEPPKKGAARRTLEQLSPYIGCLEVAMQSSDTVHTKQLSRWNLSCVEALLQVHLSAKDLLQKSKGATRKAAAKVVPACEDALRPFLRQLSVFGMEEDLEILLWIARLGQPESPGGKNITFFCRVLHTVLSRPGTIRTILIKAADSSEARDGRQNPEPSLFLAAALWTLSQPVDSSGPVKGDVDLSSCCRLVESFVLAEARVLPDMVSQLIRLVEQAGVWGSAAAGDGMQGTPGEEGAQEAIRQELLRRLAQLKPDGPNATAASKRGQGAKRRKLADGAGRLEVSLCELLQIRQPECLPEGSAAMTLGDLRQEVCTQLQTDEQGALHCGAYGLLTALCSSSHLQPADSCWQCLILRDLVPAILTSSSRVLEHVLNHPFWPQLVSSLQAAHDNSANNLHLTLVFHLLSSLMLGATAEGFQWKHSDGELAALLVRTCRTTLLPLWQHVFMLLDDSELKAEYDRLLEGTEEGKLDLGDSNSGAKTIATIFARVGLLDELICAALSHFKATAFASMMAALLASSRALAAGGTKKQSSAYMELVPERRADILGVLVKAVASGEGKGADMVLEECLNLDREGFLRYALSTEPAQVLLSGPVASHCLSNPGIVVLLKQICWVNPTFRHSLAKRLSWGACEPRALLSLAAALLSMAPDDAIKPPCLSEDQSLEADALLPLPEGDELLLLLSHAQAQLVDLILEAEAKAGGPLAREWLALQVDERRGAGMEDGLLRFLAAAEAASPADHKAAARQACKVITSLGQGVSKKLQKKLEAYGEVLYQACPEAAALLLSTLLKVSEASPPKWQSSLAGKLLVQGRDHWDEWLLVHCLHWWSHLTLPDKVEKSEVLQEIQLHYRASLTLSDRCRRQILLDDAAARAAAGMSAGARLVAVDDLWSFRRWCSLLPAWEGGSWTWTLEKHRVKETLDKFPFDRPMREQIACASEQQLKREAAPSEASSYDIGYVVPFLAGQLRIAWGRQKDEPDHWASRLQFGPILYGMASGGALELLIMSCGCSDNTIRAAACEALSIFLAMAEMWKLRDSHPFKEILEVVQLLHLMRTAVSEPAAPDEAPPPLPRHVASLFCACTPRLLEPQHFLYKEIGYYILKQPFARPGDIPLFEELLLSGIQQSHEARVWLFKSLRRGLAGRAWGAAGVSETSTTHFTRKALGSTKALELLMSFAGSHELGSFTVWKEAVTLLEAFIGSCFLPTSWVHTFGVAEWIEAQALRRWTGVTGKGHQGESALVLLGLLKALVASAECLQDNDPRCLAGAACVLVQQWQGTAANLQSKEESQGFARDAWLLAVRLAELSTAVKRPHEGAAASSLRTAWASRFAMLLKLLSGPCFDLTEMTEIIEPSQLFSEALTLLKVCPGSVVLHDLIISLSHQLLKEAADDGHQRVPRTQVEVGRRGPLSAGDEVLLIRAIGSMLQAAQEENLGDPKLRSSVHVLLQTLCSLPFRVHAAWRLQVLTSCILAVLNPRGVTLDGDLLASLPALAEILDENAECGSEAVGASQAVMKAASDLLAQALSAACETSQTSSRSLTPL